MEKTDGKVIFADDKILLFVSDFVDVTLHWFSEKWLIPGHTVDGSEILHQLIDRYFIPLYYKVFYIPGGWVFRISEPSTVPDDWTDGRTMWPPRPYLSTRPRSGIYDEKLLAAASAEVPWGPPLNAWYVVENREGCHGATISNLAGFYEL